MSRPPLEGIRILDFSWRWTGPTGTQLLAFLGAEVIRVEGRTRLDLLRSQTDFMGKPAKDIEQSVAFHDMNLNKMSVTVNLNSEEGVDLIKRLVNICDVVVENFRPDVMARLGLDYESLHQVKPDLIMLSVSTCGQTGPERLLAGFATIFAAISGIMEVTGYPDSPPAELRAQMDTRVGFDDAFAVIAALLHRQRTGRGQYIDLSVWEAQVCRAGDYLMEYALTGNLRPRHGNKDESMAPHNCYRCKGEDKWVSIAVGSEEEWHNLCKAIGRIELTRDARFEEPQKRWENQEELGQIIEGWTQSLTPYEATLILQKAGVAAFPSMSNRDMFSDVHLKEREFSTKVKHPAMGERVVISVPWRFSETPTAVVRPAPLLGEHNESVFMELLGMEREKLSKLISDKVIY